MDGQPTLTCQSALLTLPMESTQRVVLEGVRAISGSRHSRGSLRRAVSCAIGAVLGLSAARADTVWVRRVDGGLEERHGQIVEYRGDLLVLKRSAVRTERIAADRIDRIDARYGTRHVQAEAAFARHDYDRARQLFQEAMATESREWVQRAELARIIQCDWNLGRDTQAAQQFLVLLRSDPTLLHWEAAPLHWQAQPLTASQRRWAQEHLQDQTFAAVRLVAASWLLAGSERPRALEQLKDLAESGDAKIRFLARAQQWRVRWPSNKTPPVKEAAKTLTTVDTRLRKGPCFLIAEAHARATEKEDAVLWWLRVGLLYPHDARLAATALWRAGNQLEQSGRHPEARRLYYEILQRYPTRPEAARARKQLESRAANQKKANPS